MKDEKRALAVAAYSAALIAVGVIACLILLRGTPT